MMAGLSQQPRFVWSQEGPKGTGMPVPLEICCLGPSSSILLTVHVT